MSRKTLHKPVVSLECITMPVKIKPRCGGILNFRRNYEMLFANIQKDTFTFVSLLANGGSRESRDLAQFLHLLSSFLIYCFILLQKMWKKLAAKVISCIYYHHYIFTVLYIHKLINICSHDDCLKFMNNCYYLLFSQKRNFHCIILFKLVSYLLQNSQIRFLCHPLDCKL